eukprot:gene9942-11658_t
MSAKRRDSLTHSAKKVYIDNNPLSGGSLSGTTTIHVENIVDAKPISGEDLIEIVLEPLKFTDDNESRLDILESVKEPYLFSSGDLVKIVEVTSSLKTRIAMITMLGPRLSDPNSHVATFTDMFRFNEDKKTVEEVLKARTNALNASQFTKKAAGSTLLRGGPGGRGGRGGASMMTGRGGGVAVAGRGRPTVTRQLSNSSMSPKLGSSKKSPGKVAEEVKPVRKNPEICPEDSQSESPSPSGSVATLDASLDFTSPVKRTMVVEPILTTPVTSTLLEDSIIDNTHIIANTTRTAINNRVIDALSDSPNTDSETSTMISCGTPRDGATNKTEPTAEDDQTKPKLSPVQESKVSTTSSTPVEGTAPVTAPATASSASPVPFVITARAIQKAPVASGSRRGSSQSQTASSANTPTLTPNLTPSTSNTNLAGLGASQSAAAPVAVASSSAHSTRSNQSPVPPVTHSSGGLSTSIAAYKDFDLAPMVADCKPEKGVSSLKSMFSGTGGTNSNKSLPPKAPTDTPAKTRAVDVPSAFAFKPATSTANSLRLFRPADTSYAGSIDARSLAPAPIVIPGATLSLAEMRAKFSRGGSETCHSSPGPSPLKHQSSLSDPTRRATHSVQGSPAASPTAEPRVLIRRHSEFALGSNSNTDSAMLAALNAAYTPISNSNSSSKSSTASAETAGAGADLAQRCASALNMSRAEFLFLEREDPLFVPEISIDGAQQLPQYSYREVVRRNFVKVYEELNQNELELFVSDEDFVKAFGRTKAEYAKQPRWRQVEQKKKAMLF